MKLLFTLFIFHFFLLTSFAQNEEENFTIGVVNKLNTMLTDHTQTPQDLKDGYDRESYTEPFYNGYPTSHLNQFALDGFNTIMPFAPYGQSDNHFASYLRLAKKLNMKVLPFCADWYVPLSDENNGKGINVYNNDLSGAPWFLTNQPTFQDPMQNEKARNNFDYLFENVFTTDELKDVLLGYNIGGELNFKHIFNKGTETCQWWNKSIWFDTEVPPTNVDEAIEWFNNRKVGNQKTYVSYVNHGASFHYSSKDYEWANNTSFQNEPIDYDYFPYLILDNKPDIASEDSYTTWNAHPWLTERYSNINNDGPGDNHHYLSKFSNIDFLKNIFSEVHTTISASVDSKGGNSLICSTNLNNANFMWFQAYTSIIHGVNGIYLYCGDDLTTDELWKHDYKGADRYTKPYQSNIYINFVSHLGSELRYLSNNGFLSPTPEHVVLDKTDAKDFNDVVPKSTSYIPKSLPREKRKEYYGLRYTIRVNDLNDVIIIISNPLNISLDVDLNFANILLPAIENATGVEYLFEDKNDQFHLLRNSGINLQMNSIVKKYYQSFNENKTLTVHFAPLDVHILKFTQLNSSDQ